MPNYGATLPIASPDCSAENCMHHERFPFYYAESLIHSFSCRSIGRNLFSLMFSQHFPYEVTQTRFAFLISATLSPAFKVMWTRVVCNDCIWLTRPWKCHHSFPPFQFQTDERLANDFCFRKFVELKCEEMERKLSTHINSCENQPMMT